MICIIIIIIIFTCALGLLLNPKCANEYIHKAARL